MEKQKKSPMQSTEVYCSITGFCSFFRQISFDNICDYYKKKLSGGPMECASTRLRECLDTDPLYQEEKKAVWQKEVRGHVVTVYKEDLPKKNDPPIAPYKFYGRVKDIPGCFIVGNTKEQVLARAPNLINLFTDAELEHRKGPLKLISVKFKAPHYKVLAQYAEHNQLSISAAIRYLAVQKLKEEGYKL